MPKRGADKTRRHEQANRPAWALAGAFAFGGETFSFYKAPEMETRWRHYLAAGAVLMPPPAQFDTIGSRIIEFLGPVRERILSGEISARTWPPRGPWR